MKQLYGAIKHHELANAQPKRHEFAQSLMPTILTQQRSYPASASQRRPDAVPRDTQEK